MYERQNSIIMRHTLFLKQFYSVIALNGSALTTGYYYQVCNLPSKS